MGICNAKSSKSNSSFDSIAESNVNSNDRLSQYATTAASNSDPGGHGVSSGGNVSRRQTTSELTMLATTLTEKTDETRRGEVDSHKELKISSLADLEADLKKEERDKSGEQLPIQREQQQHQPDLSHQQVAGDSIVPLGSGSAALGYDLFATGAVKPIKRSTLLLAQQQKPSHAKRPSVPSTSSQNPLSIQAGSNNGGRGEPLSSLSSVDASSPAIIAPSPSPPVSPTTENKEEEQQNSSQQGGERVTVARAEDEEDENPLAEAMAESVREVEQRLT